MGKYQTRKQLRNLKKRIKQSQKSTKYSGTTNNCKKLQRKAAKLARKIRNRR